MSRPLAWLRRLLPFDGFDSLPAEPETGVDDPRLIQAIDTPEPVLSDADVARLWAGIQAEIAKPQAPQSEAGRRLMSKPLRHTTLCIVAAGRGNVRADPSLCTCALLPDVLAIEAEIADAAEHIAEAVFAEWLDRHVGWRITPA